MHRPQEQQSAAHWFQWSCAGGGEGEAAHDLVRLDRVAEQETRAVFRAIAALVAGGLADGVLDRRRLELALDDVMVARQHDGPGRRLDDGPVQIVRGLAHHQAADAQHGIGRGGTAGGRNAFAETRADRDGERPGLADGAGDGERLVRDRPALGGGGDVDERLDIAHDRADLQRNAARRDEPAGGLVHKVIFIAGGIIVAEQMHPHGGAPAGSLDGGDCVLVLRLDAHDAGARADGLHGEPHALHDLRGLMLHHDGVLVQERLALGAVGDDRVRLGRQLDMRGKSAAARAHHPGPSDLFNKVHEKSSPDLCQPRSGDAKPKRS